MNIFAPTVADLEKKLGDTDVSLTELEANLGLAALAHEENPSPHTETALARVRTDLDRGRAHRETLASACNAAKQRAQRDEADLQRATLEDRQAALRKDLQNLGTVGRKLSGVLEQLTTTVAKYGEAQRRALSHSQPDHDGLEQRLFDANLLLVRAVDYAVRSVPGARPSASAFIGIQRLTAWHECLPTAADIPWLAGGKK